VQVAAVLRALVVRNRCGSKVRPRLHHIEAKPESHKYKSKRLTERTLNIANVSPHDIVIGHAPARLRRRSPVARASQRITSHVNSVDTVDRPGRCWPSRPDLGWWWPSRLVATAAEKRLSFRRNLYTRFLVPIEPVSSWCLILALSIQIGRKSSPYNSEDKEVSHTNLAESPKCGLSRRRWS
jgi:hypothetical protein